jgi:hypothetical protein
MSWKRLVYVCDDLATLKEIAGYLSQRHLSGWSWSVLSHDPAAVQNLGIPVTPFLMQKDVLRLAAQGCFWGGMLGTVVAMATVTQISESHADLRAATLWGFPLCLSGFGGWLGGLLGLSRDHPFVAPFLGQVNEGRYLILVRVKEMDVRLLRKVMAIAGATAIAEFPVVRLWSWLFPPRGEERG